MVYIYMYVKILVVGWYKVAGVIYSGLRLNTTTTLGGITTPKPEEVRNQRRSDTLDLYSL